jgi:deoxyribodipyrimidine photo-lyase
MSDSSAPWAIHWFRRDLRISDNTSLLAAREAAPYVLPIYIRSDWKGSHPWTGPGRQHFLCECLKSLARNLDHIGSRLVIRSGDPLKVFEELIENHPIAEIHYNADPDPHGQKVETALANLCKKHEIASHGHHDIAMHRFEETTKDDSTAYRVYTPYSKNWLKLDKPDTGVHPRTLDSPKNVSSEDLPTLESWQLSLNDDHDFLPGGEAAARERLKTAIEERLPNYADQRDIPGVSGTSRLSQDLRWGSISIREVYHKVEEVRRATNSSKVQDSFLTFIKELAWRDFYLHLLEAYPEVLELEFNAKYRGLPWDEPGEAFEAWKEGQTGFPIVDAGMRQLRKTGFMHNRVRMITAMFLTKDLHLDWRLGEQHFAQHLLDGEIASNNGGWQWSAGTGADAAPYFRIQNPWTQSKRFDVDGDYIKTWVPELNSVDAKKLHQVPAEGDRLTKNYPAPLLDHSKERQKTLNIFKKHLDQQK